ncbi:RING finger protein 38-like protein [Leptotrombidium deliense]|uniref:RING finger protein 38-like protein n=1 Tax=Leptotrombidium deliense TaxID=299467 RepID=A0A443SSI7_9ACAR|nr:RING finger protein 38-like protein [Leptotrombidium deliense]
MSIAMFSVVPFTLRVVIDKENRRRYLLALEEALRQMATYVYENECDEKQCYICINEFEKNDLIRPLRCKHEFHVQCVDRWLRCKNECPLCKATAVDIRCRPV